MDDHAAKSPAATVYIPRQRIEQVGPSPELPQRCHDEVIDAGHHVGDCRGW